MNNQIYIASKPYSYDELKNDSSINQFPEYANQAIDFIKEWKTDEAHIIANTSGSTGAPKKITLLKEDMINSAIATGSFFGFKPKAKHFSPLSAKFIAGKMMLVRSLHWDTELHLLPFSSNPLQHCNNSFDFGVMTPHQLSVGLSSDASKNIENIETLLLGGSPVNKALENKIQELKCSIFLGYGMTETMSHVALRRLNGSQKSKEYIAVEGVKFQQNERDCLVIYTDHLSIGKIETNDVVELIEDNRFIWKGRHDHVINSGGIKFFPEEIEQKLSSIIPYPYYISSESHDHLGQQIVLKIEGKEIPELISKIEKLLSKYEIPKRIYYLSEFSYTKTGKIIRK